MLIGQCVPTIAQASGGTWMIGAATLAPGEPATIEVRFAGDGRTTAAQVRLVLDPARLTAVGAEGSVPGQCGVAPNGRIQVLAIDESDRPLPVDPFLACRVVIEARRPQPGGTVQLRGTDAICASANSAGPCMVHPGRIMITGSMPSPTPEPRPEPQIAVLLSASAEAPTVDMLIAFDWSGNEPPPVRGLTEPRPVSVWPAMRPRAAGDFARMLRRHPNTARGRLERYVLVNYASVEQVSRAVAGLRADPFVEFVDDSFFRKVDARNTTSGLARLWESPKSSVGPYHISAMGLDRAWAWAGGWSLIGILDTGLDRTHPALRSFTPTGQYTGGNFLPVYSGDLGRTDYGSCPNNVCVVFDPNPDERKPEPTPAGWQCPTYPHDAPECAGLNLGPNQTCVVSDFVGHGTHVAGLVAASGVELSGACPHCGIAAVKIAKAECLDSLNPPRVGFGINSPAIAIGVGALAQTASQVVNMSFGRKMADVLDCVPFPHLLWCLNFAFATENDVALIAASGNDLHGVNWPATDPRILTVGGLGLDLGFWDDRPNCPYGSTDLRECGSNSTIPTWSNYRQELMAPAKSVVSTIYRGFDWNPDLLCGDSFGGGAINDGMGLCTGTSMSAAIISGIAGILRSINPLVPVGDPFTAVDFGIRDVLAASTERAVAGLGWDPAMGFGRPDVEIAVRRMLGTVAGSTVTNRVTPLFVLWSEGAKDLINVATPQLATALARYQSAQAETRPSDGPTTPGYTRFPTEPEFSPPVPRAALYVLTTEFSPGYPGQLLPTPIPLYVVERTRPFPDGCTPGNPPCNVENRDYVLVNSVIELEAAVAGGYNHRGRQGYIFPVCSPEPACMPPGTVRVLRLCDPTIDDCAVFPESQLSLWQSRGYTQQMFSGGATVLGYAYPNIDSDGDGLIDGMEYVIGTNPFAADSNSDGIIDGLQFPQAGVSFSDPCSGANTCLRLPQDLFADGFE
jgi:subtilisin family serine protease